MTTDLSKYLDMYVSQTKEDLEMFSQKLLVMENNPDDFENINECFRLAHTIKGNAATMMFKETSKLAHAMENILDAIRSKQLAVEPTVIDIFFQCVDALEMMIEAVKEKKPEPDIQELLDLIEEQINMDSQDASELELEEGITGAADATQKEGEKAKKKKKIEEKAAPKRAEKTKAHEKGKKGDDKQIVLFRIQLSNACRMLAARAFIAIRKLEKAGRIIEITPGRETIESEKFERKFSVLIETKIDPSQLVKELSAIKDMEKVSFKSEGIDEKIERKKKGNIGLGKGLSEIGSIRVKMNRLDELLDSVGELVISKIRLAEISASIDSEQLTDSVQALDRLTGELQYNVLRIRMVPIDIVFSKFPRMVRDLSKQMKKEIEVIMEGHEIELDRSVIDKLGELLVHLIRNCIDHGIELPKKREKVGKPRLGTIRLSAAQEQNRVIIIVEDDGGGIDPDKIRQKASERGMYSKEELRSMTDEEVMSILATPGFSTAEKVTITSGRGVGLDAVKAGVEAFGGHMEIESTKGRGMRIIIRLPLTLAIILAMMVKISNEVYAIPLDPIIETISISPEDVNTLGGSKVIRFRGEILPLIYVSTLLEISDKEEGDRAVVVAIGQTKWAIVIDELLGQREIVVKPLDKHLRKIPFFGGATILGSGEVALILDIPGLFEYAREQMKMVRIQATGKPRGDVVDA